MDLPLLVKRHCLQNILELSSKICCKSWSADYHSLLDCPVDFHFRTEERREREREREREGGREGGRGGGGGGREGGREGWREGVDLL